MKKIAVIGLGIIGGSICAALTKAGYKVDGIDVNPQSVEIALEKGYISEKAQDLACYDVVFIAVPPKATMSILDTITFKDDAIVSDICGVKYKVEQVVYQKPRNYRYIGLHPMAGKETSGIQSATPELFHGANLVIAVSHKTDLDALNEIKSCAKAMCFGRIVECTALEHDKKIALTSQLAHIVSNAYVKSPQVQDCKGFTGGSFQDMTRIAGVDENMWSQLYMSNRKCVLDELEILIANLQEYKMAIENDDEDLLRDKLKEGRLIRETIKYKKK